MIVATIIGLLAAAYFAWRSRTAPPAPGDPVYEQATRAFYHGLAALEVGLLDDARQQFMRATELVAQEPASWVNLGVTELRRGELEAAAAPIERALTLAPDHGDVVLVAGRMEIARGRIDAGLAHLRRAVQLDARGLRSRFTLAREIAQSGAAGAEDDAQAIFDELAQLAPDNVAVLVERARLAARRRDAERLRDSVARLEPQAAAWPPLVSEQYAALRRAVEAGNFDDAARATAPLRNVLASVPSFRENLAAVQTATELIAEPIPNFIVLAPVSAMPAPPDTATAFTTESLDSVGAAFRRPSASAASILAASQLSAEGAPLIVAAGETEAHRLDGAGSWPVSSPRAILALDWNNDFLTDLLFAGSAGVRLLLQDAGGSFTDRTEQAGPPVVCDCTGAWAADIEMDGDLDVILGVIGGPSVVLRNNGNGSWTLAQTFTDVADVRGFGWADLDRDADPDAVFLDASGAVHVFRNRQAGNFVRVENVAAAQNAVAMTVADVNADGLFDIVLLDLTGVVRRLSPNGERWDAVEIAEWQGLNRAQPGSHRLIAADLDNNGAVDLVAAGGRESRIWLANERHQLTGLQTTPEGEVYSVLDLNGDGRLDLVATTARGAVRHLGRGAAPYHWKVIRTRGQQSAGDQRINSFGVGGDIEVRSGLLVQKQPLSGAPIHVGLGTHANIDVARIVWPNGVAQAEFAIGVDDTIVAQQRLKGSCPWVFAWDGTRMRFVTDFLWRSPLGLRINAQDTAGVSQTEDWVRISGGALAAHNGSYDVRITAELWETHFFDHVSLMVVDHPTQTDVFVDERFSPAFPPALAVQVVGRLQPVAHIRDERERDVTLLLEAQDGRYLASFERGAYQGIAADHWIEFDPPDAAGGRTTLIANGWIYPTDSSINVAIAQGGHVQPRGLSLEALTSDGRWQVVKGDLGFPAGKNKTVLIDLDGTSGARRLRLRTNLEIYWDWLAFAPAVEASVRTVKLDASSATLRYRGFSQTTSWRGEAPETPDYDRIAGIGQRWRDLEGFHTRFGDVKELIASIDDRYAIMNAGDELRLLFPEVPPPPAGWRRDFVLIGDGWEKDGDYNTGYSQTVLPLPSHDNPAYRAASEPPQLESDPVYRRHRADWQQYHTRYVAPDVFVRGLRSH